MSEWISKFDETCVKHINNNESIKLQYGTAGFRNKADILDFVFYRMGILASLRSIYKNNQSIGLMITASHNPEEDNGIKLIDPTGEMLEKNWEIIATEFIQCNNNEFKNYLINKIKELNININNKSTVMVGYDTRASSKILLEASIDGLNIFNTNIINYNLVTTPMLHFFVNKYNTDNKVYEEDYYFEYYANSFINYNKKYINSSNNKNYFNIINFDGANGIGSIKIINLINKLNNYLNINIYNNNINTKGQLNYKCGADYIKTKKLIPNNINKLNSNEKYLSVDGDADRIIYWFLNKKNAEQNGNENKQDGDYEIKLLDGDRITVLFAMYINKLIIKNNLSNVINIKVIQTAYTNGSCTNYIKNNLNIDVIFTSTGVKYLHHEALKHEIGIYFEANGHGTVLYSNKLINILKEKNDKNSQEFLNFIEMTNQTVGDSFSIMLLIETILNAEDITLSSWYNFYIDYPSELSTLVINDRDRIITINADTEILEPKHIQNDINQCIKQYKNSRSFVRPSGTEDIVRIYVETENQENVKQLTQQIHEIVKKYLC